VPGQERINVEVEVANFYPAIASRLGRFLYIDRVVVAERWRRHGLARMLYEDLFKRAIRLRHSRIVCEVNVPNPVSDKFHEALGFEEIGRATFDDGATTVRYLAAHLRPE